ncbi:hypothetical protein [Paraburkholderia unamae]|uniref:Uncharacterized protein n=1 Tax=Paraburkholderia unamae TaxID=219649 RepID=A0ABX5KUY6_9BURK|nr:hypothetical protein [Paraburkholderia unamae]PVX85820.1 hypothetical protein C7402_103398 [Paraburkholderia unamae]
MDDYGWLVRESAASWLRGGGDGRFQTYERFYRKARLQDAGFDLEAANEDYGQWLEERPSRLVGALARPAVAHGLIMLVALWSASRALPTLASAAPKTTGVALVAAFIALRVMRQRRR